VRPPTSPPDRPSDLQASLHEPDRCCARWSQFGRSGFAGAREPASALQARATGVTIVREFQRRLSVKETIATEASGRLDSARTGSAKRGGEAAVGPALSGPAAILALQQSTGNRRVAELLGTARAPSLAVQRELYSANDFGDKFSKAGVGKSQTGGSIIFDLNQALRSYHRENDKKTKADKDTLVKSLETIIQKCEAWIKAAGKTPKPPDDEKAKVVDKLLKDAEAELGVLDPSKIKKAAPPPPLPVQGTTVQDRLRWMEAKTQQSNATEPEKAAGPLITAARKELYHVLNKQKAQMAADSAKADQDYKLGGEKQREADAITLRGGNDALSAMLGRLFALFGLTPLSFESVPGATSPSTLMKTFADQAKARLRALNIKGTTREHSGFDDVELVVSGSSALGYSPHKFLADKKTHKPFGKDSDVDLGVVSPKLLAACEDAGVGLRGLGDRTEPDPLLSIAAVSKELGALVQRKVSIMVFATRETAQRGVGVQVG
jgi:hypothetical protein